MDKKYVVYQHVTPDEMYYFGQTQNVEKRWSNNGIYYRGTALQPYIERFGWDNIQHIILFRDQTRENALWIEDFLITTAREDGVCINQRRSGNISKEEGYSQEYYEQNKDKKKEYYEQNKEQIREYQQQYRERNKQQIQEQNKQYYEENKEQIKEQHKQYYEQNKQQIQERQKQYRQRKKEEQQFKELGCLPLW